MAHAADVPAPIAESIQDLTELGLEDLMKIEVTSVSKKVQPLSQASAAIFVLTQEDIRRSGANSIPEALRMVPGLIVARIDANKWAISSRFDTGRFADDLLVMMDGRTVYSPSLGGTFWEVQDTILEDIERIEVIRGPGGTLWGANAVNGAINIITKRAKDTHGNLITLGGGTEERGFTSLRHGGHIGDTFHYRVFGKAFDRDRSFNPEGAHDDWRMGRAGFRADWEIGQHDQLMIHAESYQGRAGQQTTVPTLVAPDFSRTAAEDARLSGTNTMLRWTHTFQKANELAVQVYYDRIGRNELSFHESRQTYDLDLQHRFSLPFNQDVLWGFGYRHTTDTLSESALLSFDPSQRTLTTFSGMLQDEIRLFNDSVRLTIGSKFLKHTYTNLLILPNIRMAWSPVSNHTIWGAITRSARLPTRLERDGLQRLTGGAGGFEELRGTPQLRSEDLIGYELGYRSQWTSSLSADIALSYTTERYKADEAELAPGIEARASKGKMHGYAAEIAMNWQLRDWWRIRPAFTYLYAHGHSEAGEGHDDESGEIPRYQLSFRSLINLSKTLEFDSTFRFVDQLAGVQVPSYTNLDLRLGWKPTESIELSLVGHNLLAQQHLEYMPQLLNTQPVQIQRGMYGKVTWRF
ncbi:MAG: TonB-dependent receptor [Nitrospira sp.]|nr:TonB-dependent receptor [Nitrospira sp.]